MFCPDCGKKLKDGIKFCPNCGCSINTGANNFNNQSNNVNQFNSQNNNSNTSSPFNSQNNNSKSGFFSNLSTGKKILSVIVICCLALFIIGAIGSFISPDSNTNSVSSNDSDSFKFTNSDGDEFENPYDDENSSDSDDGSSTNKEYDAGTYRVGDDIDEGEYKFTQTNSYGGYLERSSDSSGELSSVISTEVTSDKGETVYISVEDGEYLKVSGGTIQKV